MKLKQNLSSKEPSMLSLHYGSFSISIQSFLMHLKHTYSYISNVHIDCCMGPFLKCVINIHLDFNAKRIRKIPQKRHTILVNEILSAKPCNAIPVVTIKTTGPTRASKELI